MSEGTDGDVIVITDPQKDRYFTLGLMSWWQIEGVRKARVMVVGAGALGNEVLKNLALMGVGYILVVDMDTIEDANLSRSILFRASDNGRFKAKVAADRVKEINPDVMVSHIVGDVTREVGLGAFRYVDVIIGCLDNREARLFVNRACWKMNKPWIDGAIDEMNGLARIFVPPDSACYECTLTELDYRSINIRYSCPLLAQEKMLQGRIPTTPTISSIIGGVQAQEALKILHGMEVNAGSALIFSGLTNDCYTTSYRRKNDCQSHCTYEPIIELGHGVQATTTGKLLEVATHELGNDPILDLGRDIVLRLACSQCGTTTDVYRVLGKVSEAEAECSSCQEPMVMDITHTVHASERGLMEKTLAEVGIPPFDIIAASNETSCCYFELSGDRAHVMGIV